MNSLSWLAVTICSNGRRRGTAAVDLVCGWPRRASRAALSCLPGATKVDKSIVTALRTRAMARCERCGFVQEEKFCVSSWRHDGSLSPAKLQHAHEPTLHQPESLDVTLVVVENAAIAHERTPLRRCDNLSRWCNPVLPGHGTAPEKERIGRWREQAGEGDLHSAQRQKPCPLEARLLTLLDSEIASWPTQQMNVRGATHSRPVAGPIMLSRPRTFLRVDSARRP